MVDGAPTTRSFLIAAELRRLRAEAGLTCEEVAEQLLVSASKISRLETGKRGMQLRDVRDLLNLYGADPEHRDALVELARRSRDRDWWHRYNDVIPEWFQAYVNLETEAQASRFFAIDVVPGLLQTEEYARAVLESGQPAPSKNEVERQIKVRKERQERVTRGENPLDVWVILDEAALRRRVGGSKLMRNQLLHLRDLAWMSNVTVQMLQFTAGAHASIGHKFVILDFAQPTEVSIVYAETLTSSLYVDEREEIDRYTLVFEHLRAKAIDPEESRRRISEIANEET